MSCLFGSCFGENLFRRRGEGYGARDSTLRSRRVLVRTSTEKQIEPFSYRRSISSYVDEKIDLHERDGLLDDYNEDAEERSTHISNKQIEAGRDSYEKIDEETKQRRRLQKKSIIYRPSKGKSGKGSPGPLVPHNTGDELHRRAEFERKVKKMLREEQERAWAAEHEQRERWMNDRKQFKQRA
ncbi:hypothetical protein K469DRAFT_689030 [Zopfia rhizophila CBS 207.26]|uniref:Uncharacterized protein n=1 Tax=Zopfia rhizophila CBS 207.26 TaxID=1314779 RepID=A0A6A6ET37_9PEZI|nr:hypothetical protein K469DRAFT_689030 [Zopfia rhizophila CBS 207.26]